MVINWVIIADFEPLLTLEYWYLVCHSGLPSPISVPGLAFRILYSGPESRCHTGVSVPVVCSIIYYYNYSSIGGGVLLLAAISELDLYLSSLLLILKLKLNLESCIQLSAGQSQRHSMPPQTDRACAKGSISATNVYDQGIAKWKWTKRKWKTEAEIRNAKLKLGNGLIHCWLLATAHHLFGWIVGVGKLCRHNFEHNRCV